MKHASLLRNPHLEGGSFFWRAGTTGVLLCHGFTATTAEVRLLAEALHRQGYSVAAPLLPGHGTTPEDCNRHTWQEWYGALEHAYQDMTVNCQQVIVGGESTGALLALHLAHKYPSIPAILCYAPALRLKMSPVKIFFLSLLVPFVTSIPKPPSTDNNPWQGYLVHPLKGARELLRLQKASYSLLPQIHRPILIMQGRLDPTVHPGAPQVIYDRIGSSDKELHWLENSTHCVILDQERDLAISLTLEFLQRVLG